MTDRLFAFDPNGNIYACTEEIGDEEFSIGTYYPELMVNSDKWSVWKEDVLADPNCNSCFNWPICGSGCKYSKLKKANHVCKNSDKTLEVILRNEIQYK